MAQKGQMEREERRVDRQNNWFVNSQQKLYGVTATCYSYTEFQSTKQKVDHNKANCTDKLILALFPVQSDRSQESIKESGT